jgi:hypothetical protein
MQEGFFGSLQDIVAHQQRDHNAFEPSFQSQKELKAGLRFRFSKPLEVSCAIFALLEVGDLDPEGASLEDFNSLDGGRYRWDNSRAKRKYFWKWSDLVRPLLYFSELQ